LRRPFVFQASILQVGAFGQFGISFVSSLLIARLLGPSGYGVWALATALSGIVGLLLDFGQANSSLIQFSEAFARRDKDASARVAATYFKSLAVLYLFIGLPCYLAAGSLGKLVYDRPDLGHYVRLFMFVGIATA